MTEREPVGSLAEEAAKLLAAVHGWVDDPTATAPPAPADGDDHKGLHEHSSAGAAAECRWCPLCQLMRMARATSPDVRAHLTQAAVSMALAVQGLLDDSSNAAGGATPLEKIDLTED